MGCWKTRLVSLSHDVFEVEFIIFRFYDFIWYFWFEHSLDPRAEIGQIFHCFLVNIRHQNSPHQNEIFWPFNGTISDNFHATFLYEAVSYKIQNRKFMSQSRLIWAENSLTRAKSKPNSAGIRGIFKRLQSGFEPIVFSWTSAFFLVFMPRWTWWCHNGFFSTQVHFLEATSWSSLWSRTTNAQRENSLHCTAENSLPLQNF